MFDPSKAKHVIYRNRIHGIDGLTGVIANTFHQNPQSNSLFLFCGRKKDRIKGLYWDSDGYILLYKRLEIRRYQWPRNESELK
ncbi:MAG: IS66 family insertion sequence element accessory protein TnpB [Anaerolineaceae bacterium]|nr:IS66 family insertion sequence element accessory protein TnpB [Anaerolineaceae bacterium]